MEINLEKLLNYLTERRPPVEEMELRAGYNRALNEIQDLNNLLTK